MGIFNMKQLVITVFIIIMLSGCNSLKVKQKASDLDDAITHYGVALRWAHYQDAYSYHVTRDGRRPKIDIDKLEEVSVTGVNVVDELMNPELTEAVVTSEISYYLKSYGSIKKLKLEQTWWYSEDAKRWLNEGEFPQFEMQ